MAKVKYGLEMAKLPAGTYTMGWGQRVGVFAPFCKMTLSKGFNISKYLVTQKLWRDVMKTQPWKKVRHDDKGFIEGPDRPAVCVSYNDVHVFLEKLNKQSEKTYALPTEVQWEYAIRAGTDSRYFWGEDHKPFKKYAWCYNPATENPDELTLELQSVGKLKPNSFGLFDMAGLVCEWVRDKCDTKGMNIKPGHYPEKATDFVSLKGTTGIIRSTHYGGFAVLCASAYKNLTYLDFRSVTTGFRLVEEEG